jgi:quercetin dioxygenase-like cupin family protein
MSSDVHASRREPAPPTGLIDLREAADEVLTQARSLSAGRSGRTLTPGAGAPLKQTLLALTAGAKLQEHASPGPTTLLGLIGTVVLHHEGGETRIVEGAWVACPAGPHSLEADADAVVLITVAPTSARTPAQ